MKAKDIVIKAKRIADIVNSKYINQEEDKEILNEAYRALWQIITGTATDWLLESAFIPRTEAERIYYNEVYTPPEKMAKLRSVKLKRGDKFTLLEKSPKLEDGEGLGYRLITQNKIQLVNSRYSDYEGILLEYYEEPKEVQVSLLQNPYKVFGRFNQISNVFFNRNKIYFTSKFGIDGVDPIPIRIEGKTFYSWILNTEKDKITAIDRPLFQVFNNYVVSITQEEQGHFFPHLYRREPFFTGNFISVGKIQMNSSFKEWTPSSSGLVCVDENFFYPQVYTLPNDNQRYSIKLLQRDFRRAGMLSGDIEDYSLNIKKEDIKVDPQFLFRLVDGWAIILKEEGVNEYLPILDFRYSLKIGNDFSDIERVLRGILPIGDVASFPDISRDLFLSESMESINTARFEVERPGAIRINGRNYEYNFSDGTIKITDGNDKCFLSGSESDKVYTKYSEGHFTLYCDLNDNIELPNGVSYDWLSYYIAEYYLRKQERDVSNIRAIRAEKEQQLLAELTIDEYRPSKIANVFGNRRF